MWLDEGPQPRREETLVWERNVRTRVASLIHVLARVTIVCLNMSQLLITHNIDQGGATYCYGDGVTLPGILESPGIAYARKDSL